MAITNYTNIDPAVNELEKISIFKTRTTLLSDQQSSLLDKDWAKQAFLTADRNLEADDITNRYWSSNVGKFTDTRLGGNIGINSRPQFNRYGDIRSKGRLAGRAEVSLTETTGDNGMGRYYSEAIDDPSQTVYLRFGVPQFNTLTNFLRRAFDGGDIAYNRTGRFPAVYMLGKIVGTLTAMTAFPIIATGLLVGKAINFFFGRETSRFYTLKPTMHLYWSAVQMLVSALAINSGIFPKVMNQNTGQQKIGKPFTVDQDQLDMMHSLAPDIFNTQNGIDIYAVANKGQRLANRAFDRSYGEFEDGTSDSAAGVINKELSPGSNKDTGILNNDKIPNMMDYLNNVLKLDEYYISKNAEERLEVDPKLDENKPKGDEKDRPGWFDKYVSFFNSEFRDGSQFAVFKVDHTGSVSESFSNATAESDLSQKLNGISSQARQARFSFADGNLAGGVLGMAASAVGAAKDLALGALDGVTMGFSNLITGLGGSGYIDIPKTWQSSSVNLPRASYSIQLISPYGNPISRLMNIYVPLAMLLAAALPRSTGRASYTSPFLCQLFDRGRCQVKLGMIESLSIERGTSNLQFNLKGDALAINVTFTVVDLSSIMHMPTSGGSLLETNMTIDEDNILSDYLAVLAGQDIYSQAYAIPKAKLRLAKTIAKYMPLSSPAFWASTTNNILTEHTLGIGKILQAPVAGAAVFARGGNTG
jgi:hypothetical protein